MSTLSTFFDMVYVQVSGSPGTGNATLGSALIGFQTPAAAGITNGTPVSYRMTDGTNWETAHGTIGVSGSTYTLVRGVDTIKSSNSNSLVSFGSSGVTVLICPLSQDLNALVSTGAAQSFNSTQQAQGRTNLGIAAAAFVATGASSSISSSSSSPIIFPNTTFNTGSFYDTSTGEWTPPAGLVMFNFMAFATAVTLAAGAKLFTVIKKNGSVLFEHGVLQVTANANIYGDCSGLDRANGTDYYTVTASMAAGTATLSNSAIDSWFSGAWLAP